MKTAAIKKLMLLLAGLLALNFVSYLFYARFDLTIDQRYTLSKAAKDIVARAESPLIIDVFLDGDFPAEFERLQTETRQLLEEFAAENDQVVFNFIDPLEDGADAQAVATQFYQMGMTPARINVVENGRTSQSVIFPWAMANYGNKSVAIPLLKSTMGATMEERVEQSVQQLQYAFADAFSQLLMPRTKKIAVMRGNGELPDARLADFIRELQQYYFVAPFTLDSVAAHAPGTFEKLSEYDLVLEARPTEAYTEAEKYVLDQYLMQGGRLLWLVDKAAVETDSLFGPTGSALAFPLDLNLEDYFFKYGLRINPALVKDLYSAPIILASGSGSDTQFNPFPWFYYPLSSSGKKHPIVHNIEAVKFEYASPIDTLENSVDKTILLSSSPRSDLAGLPKQISLEVLGAEPDLREYEDGEQPLAVLLEGIFPSVYHNRIKPFELEEPLDKSQPTAMAVVSDGSVIRNELQGQEPLELGFDRFTGSTYGNKEFLLNTVNYLLDDSGLMNLRSKEVSIAFLDLQKVDQNRLQWQLVNLVFPLVVLLCLALGYRFWRRRHYRTGRGRPSY